MNSSFQATWIFFNDYYLYFLDSISSALMYLITLLIHSPHSALRTPQTVTRVHFRQCDSTNLSTVVNGCREFFSLKTNCQNKYCVFWKGQREQSKKGRPSGKIWHWDYKLLKSDSNSFVWSLHLNFSPKLKVVYLRYIPSYMHTYINKNLFYPRFWKAKNKLVSPRRRPVRHLAKLEGKRYAIQLGTNVLRASLLFFLRKNDWSSLLS